MKSVTISVELLNSLLGYLGTKPYQETFQLIGAIQEAANAQLAAATPEVEPAAVEAPIN